MLLALAVLGGLGFGVLERDRALDKDEGDDPHEGEEEHAEDQPSQREAEDPLRHELRLEVVQQREGDQRDGEAEGAGDGQLELVTHKPGQEGV